MMTAFKIVAAFVLFSVAAFLLWRHFHPSRIWHVSSHTYESFPLVLRWPTNVDTPKNRQRFPKFAIVTHEFTHRYPDGRPEPAYNETLFDFDIAITSAFDSPPLGVPILVETFGGKRIYYFCVAPDADLAAAVERIVKRYPTEKLTWEYSTKSGWNFLSGYAARSANEISPPVKFHQ